MENQEQYAQGNKSVVSMGEWLITMLIMIIPLVNLIMLFVWLSVAIRRKVRPTGQKLN